MRVKVELKYKTVYGEVEKVEGEHDQIYYVNVNGETYKFYDCSKTPVTELTFENDFLNFVEEEGIDWDCFEEGTYYLTGEKYDIDVYFNDNDSVTVNTIHKERMERTNDIFRDDYDPTADGVTEATANERTYKTMRGLKNYILRYIDKA